MTGDFEKTISAWRREPATLGGLLTDTAYGADALPEGSGGKDASGGREVTLMGWVDTRRDLGALIFLWLRDRSIQQLNAEIDRQRARKAATTAGEGGGGSQATGGEGSDESNLANFEAAVVQVTFNPEIAPDAHKLAETLGREYVIAVKGVWRKRTERDVNPRFLGGDRELIATDLRVLSPAETPPFYIADDAGASEDLRMQYRYLDLRRKPLVAAMTARHRIFLAMRNALSGLGFLEIETPMLGRSTPEGARDYLVPARNHAGKFYALPQSPQLYKQLLMVGGMDKYFQMARCFRDEDLRANRQPEFTQLDLEMSFATRDELFEVGEKMFVEVFRETLGQEVPMVAYNPDEPKKLGFPRMTYDEAMSRYGVDKPDMRFGCEIIDLTPVFKDSEFVVFKNAIANGGAVKGIFIPDYAPSRKDIDALTEHAKKLGAGGLAWIKFNDQWNYKTSLSSIDKLSIISCKMKSLPEHIQHFINYERVDKYSSRALSGLHDVLCAEQIIKKEFLENCDYYLNSDFDACRSFLDKHGRSGITPVTSLMTRIMQLATVGNVWQINSDMEFRNGIIFDIAFSEASTPYLPSLLNETWESLSISIKQGLMHKDDLDDIAVALGVYPVSGSTQTIAPSSVLTEASICRIGIIFEKLVNAMEAYVVDNGIDEYFDVSFSALKDIAIAAKTDKDRFDAVYQQYIHPLFLATWYISDIPGTLLLVADSPVRKVEKVLGNLRVKLGNELNLAEKAGNADAWKFCWIVDFPLYDENPDTGALEPAHHPFTMPHPQFVEEYEPGRFMLRATTDAERLAIRADNYDLVLNGEELGSGSLRIIDPVLQRSVLAGIGMSELEIEEQFGFFLTAFKYGAPPHRGFALGMDRIVGMMLGGASIRDVIAFPKTATGSDLMTKAPSEVSARQLVELGIKAEE